ncbi:MAG TPA: nucleotide exchange factor GrpE, partial [Anaerolineaceae bacterium]|nr:nucleotide exchange factor GrpE [Anaerolineaceae bacterium]
MTEDTDNKDQTPTPEEVTPDLAVLQAENADLRKQNEDYLDSLQRERASFANYKRRIDLDNASYADRLLGEHVKLFLPVADDLERSLQHRPEDPDCASWISGIELILQKLLKTLEAKDVRPLE